MISIQLGKLTSENNGEVKVKDITFGSKNNINLT